MFFSECFFLVNVGFFRPLSAETWQDGLDICPKQYQVAIIFRLCHNLIITIPYFKHIENCTKFEYLFYSR